jgi:hypothetical protein
VGLTFAGAGSCSPAIRLQIAVFEEEVCGGAIRAIDDTPILSVDGQYCIGGSWKLNVGNGATNASIGLSGTSNGRSWEVRDWRKTDRGGNWIEVGAFAAGTEGSHSLRVDINGALSNIVSL